MASTVHRTVVAVAGLVLSGGLVMSAGTAASATGQPSHNGGRVVGTFDTYGACQAAGYAGERHNRWDWFECDQVPADGGYGGFHHGRPGGRPGDRPGGRPGDMLGRPGDMPSRHGRSVPVRTPSHDQEDWELRVG